MLCCWEKLKFSQSVFVLFSLGVLDFVPLLYTIERSVTVPFKLTWWHRGCKVTLQAVNKIACGPPHEEFLVEEVAVPGHAMQSSYAGTVWVFSTAQHSKVKYFTLMIVGVTNHSNSLSQAALFSSLWLFVLTITPCNISNWSADQVAQNMSISDWLTCFY